MTRWCWKDEDYKGQRRHEVQVKEGQDIWANSCQWVETQSETNFETGNVVPWMSVMLFIHALPQGYVCTQKSNNKNNNSYPLRESNLKPGTVLPVLYQIPTYMYTICVTYLTLTNIADVYCLAVRKYCERCFADLYKWNSDKPSDLPVIKHLTSKVGVKTQVCLSVQAMTLFQRNIKFHWNSMNLIVILTKASIY